MKFTILSHAGLLIEHAGSRIVCDPWLLGSCYWRSWWNFPEPDPDLIADLKADFIYLTHLHWDHYHGPSLRKLFRRRTQVLVPLVQTRRMVDDLRVLGFRNVREIPHGQAVTLGPDFRLWSYQFGLGVDSAAVLEGGGTTLFNCNDAKFLGLPLRQITRRHPRIDFIFRSHSSAGPLPYCVEDYQRIVPQAVAQADSAEQFARCALHVAARYAIPFASNHCFLHRETVAFNQTATSPEDVRVRFAQLAAAAGSPSECVVMTPGSSWSDTQGFDLRPFDFAAREAYIAAMQRRHADKLAATYAQEDAAQADFEGFRAYFSGLLRALPWVVRRMLPPVVFRARDAAGTHDWLVDPKARSVTEVDSAPPGCTVFEVHAAVLRDCAEKRLFSVWSASKRLRIRLPDAAALQGALRWFTILDLYELEHFPLARNFSPRALGVRLRRWREPVEVVRLAARRLYGRRPLDLQAIYPLPTTRLAPAATRPG